LKKVVPLFKAIRVNEERMKYFKIKTIEQYKEYLTQLNHLKSLKNKEEFNQIELLEILLNEYQERETGAFYTTLNPVELLRFILQNREISQNQLAEGVNISKQLISDVLNYRRNISKKMVLKLSTYFNLPQELFSKKYNLNQNKESIKLKKQKYKTNNPMKRDDLTKLDGINESIESLLNNADIFTYEKLSKLKEDEINSIVNEPEVSYGIDAYSLKAQSSYAATKLSYKNNKFDKKRHKTLDNMSIKDKIKNNLEFISNPIILNDILEYIMPYATFSSPKTEGNLKSVLAFAGTFSNDEAIEFTETIDSEFNKIDNEW